MGKAADRCKAGRFVPVVIAGASVAMLLTGCGATPAEGAPRAAVRDAEGAPVRESIPPSQPEQAAEQAQPVIGPEAIQPVQPVDARVSVEAEAREAAERKAREEHAAREAAAAASGSPWRADGRPRWWLDRPRWENGRLFASAEAVADDVLAARRAAVQAGRERVSAALDEGAADQRIESVLVRRISTGGSGERFVGYVLVSATRGG